MNAPIAWLVLALAIRTVQDAVGPTPSSEQGDRSTETPQAESPRVALPDELAAALAEIGLAREAGDIDAARAALHAIFDEGTYSRMLVQEHAVVLVCLAALDDVADSLGVLELMRRVREERVDLLSARLEEGHPDLIRAQGNLAVAHYALGDLAGAIVLFEHVHAVSERVLPSDHPDLLEAKGNLAGARRTLGDLMGARALEEEVLAAKERLLPPDHPDLIKARSNLAVTRYVLGDLAGAHALFEGVHAAFERLLPPDHPDLLHAKGNLAVTCNGLGDLSGALALNEQVHAVYERLLPPDHPDLLAVEQNLASTHRARGDLARAHSLFEHVHAARERVLPPDHPDLIAAKNNLAITLGELGDLSGALALNKEVHTARELLLPPDHPDLLTAKQNLAAAFSGLGDLASARALEEHVHAALERLLPEEHPNLLIAKLNLAVTLYECGDLARALALFEHVHEVRERLLPPDHPDLLVTKQGLASTRQALGDLAGSLVIKEQVHAVFERSHPSDHPDLIKAKANLANARKLQGDRAGALALEEEVHAARERLLPQDHPDVLTAKMNLADSRYAVGDFASALALFEHVHEVRERLLPPDHPDLLMAKQGLAAARRSVGDLVRAHALEEEVHSARERLLPAGHPDLLAAKVSLANARTELGDLAGALAITRFALAGELAVAAGLHSEAPRIARASALRELQRLPHHLFVSERCASKDLGSLDAEIFSVLESLRSASTSSSKSVRGAAPNPALIELRERVAASRRELNDLVLTPPEQAAEIDVWRAVLFERSEERDRLEKALNLGLAQEGRVLTIAAADVARGLARHSVLVSFLRYPRRLEKDPESHVPPSALDSLLAFVVTPDARVRRVELGPSSEIEELAERWRATIGQPLPASRGVGSVAPVPSSTDELCAGVELRARLLDPCLAPIGDEAISTVHLVLDDFLHLVPMDALPAKDGRRLGDVLEVRIESSVQRLVEKRRPAPADGVLLAIGGVDFDAEEDEASLVAVLDAATPPVLESLDRSGPAKRFDALAQTILEVEALAALFEEHSGIDPLVLTGAKASKSALRKLIPRARYLHIATHGWFAPETFTSMIDSIESESERSLFARAGKDVRGLAPETLCGLALAGANGGENSLSRVPGIVTAEELAALDLSSCELAVLSACETNVGLRRAGQGIQSLQAALHAAGARTAITSLWRVDDAATRRLMELFYTKLWSEGLRKADALWQAKMALCAEGHPLRDWSGWILSGDPD